MTRDYILVAIWQKFGVAQKIILRWNKKFDVAQKVIWFRQKRVVAQKSISCQQKKVEVAQKSISFRQKQNDAASKKYFVRKQVIFFGTARWYLKALPRRHWLLVFYVKVRGVGFTGYTNDFTAGQS